MVMGELRRLDLDELAEFVLARLAEGHSKHAIAEELDMSERAVERDIGAIFAKLDLPAGNEGHRRVLAVLTFLRS